MDNRLLKLAKQAGFEIDESNRIVVTKKNKLGRPTKIDVTDTVTNFSDILFDSIVTEWWVIRNKTRVIKPW